MRLQVVHARETRTRGDHDPRRPALHANVGGIRHPSADSDRHRRRLLRRPHQLRARERALPRRVRAQLHERRVRREGGLRVQGRAVQRLRPREAHLRHEGLGVRDRGRRLRPARHRPPPIGAEPHARALLALHAGDGLAHHGDSAGGVPRGRQARRRDGPAGQGDDARLRGRHHPPHDGLADDPLWGGAPAAARQHRPPGRRHERRARAREHPGQHRQRDLLGVPPGLPQVPGTGSADDRRLRRGERAEAESPQLPELLRRELREVPGQPAQDVVRRQGDEGQRVRLQPPAQAGGGTRPGSASSTRRSRGRWRA